MNAWNTDPSSMFCITVNGLPFMSGPITVRTPLRGKSSLDPNGRRRARLMSRSSYPCSSADARILKRIAGLSPLHSDVALGNGDDQAVADGTGGLARVRTPSPIPRLLRRRATLSDTPPGRPQVAEQSLHRAPPRCAPTPRAGSGTPWKSHRLAGCGRASGWRDVRQTPPSHSSYAHHSPEDGTTTPTESRSPCRTEHN